MAVTLLRPHYIEPIPAGSRIPWAWDDWEVEASYEPGDAVVNERLQGLQRRAQLAMCVAIAEWIAFSLEALDADPRPQQYLEAAWLGTVHFACCPYMEWEDEEWSGPVRGPLHVMMAQVNDALHFEGADPAENAAWLSTLAQHIVPVSASFTIWRDAVLHRLERWYPGIEKADDDFDDDWQALEPLVPRECFDPTAAFEPAMSIDLFRRRLAAADPNANPYLSTPEERAEAAVVLPFELEARRAAGHEDSQEFPKGSLPAP